MKINDFEIKEPIELKWMDKNGNEKYDKKKYADIVCYRCGSFDIVLLNREETKLVYKCESCGKVWIKRDVNGSEDK